MTCWEMNEALTELMMDELMQDAKKEAINIIDKILGQPIVSKSISWAKYMLNCGKAFADNYVQPGTITVQITVSSEKSYTDFIGYYDSYYDYVQVFRQDLKNVSHNSALTTVNNFKHSYTNFEEYIIPGQYYYSYSDNILISQ